MSMISLWSQLGNIQGAATLDEALKTAGLTWEVELRPIFFEKELVGDNEEDYDLEEDPIDLEMIESHQTVVRKDLQAPLGVVGRRYTPIQVSEALSVLEGISGADDADLQYHSAGSINLGARVWMLFEVRGMSLEPMGDDELSPYILVSTAHDGSRATRCNFVLRRDHNDSVVVLSRGVSIRHTASSKTKLTQAQKLFEVALDHFEQFEQLAAELAKTPMTEEEWVEFLDELIPPPDPGLKRPGKTNKKRELLGDLFIQEGAQRPTRWDAYNAVTAFATHHANYRGGGEGRINAVMFGSGHQLTVKALDLLNEGVDA